MIHFLFWVRRSIVLRASTNVLSIRNADPCRSLCTWIPVITFIVVPFCKRLNFFCKENWIITSLLGKISYFPTLHNPTLRSSIVSNEKVKATFPIANFMLWKKKSGFEHERCTCYLTINVISLHTRYNLFWILRRAEIRRTHNRYETSEQELHGGVQRFWNFINRAVQ